MVRARAQTSPERFGRGEESSSSNGQTGRGGVTKTTKATAPLIGACRGLPRTRHTGDCTVHSESTWVLGRALHSPTTRRAPGSPIFLSPPHSSGSEKTPRQRRRECLVAGPSYLPLTTLEFRTIWEMPSHSPDCYTNVDLITRRSASMGSAHIYPLPRFLPHLAQHILIATPPDGRGTG